MDQLRAALAGPHGGETIVTWVIAGVALALAVAHALRPGPTHRRWSRWVAAGFPAAVGCTLLAASVAPTLRGTALEVAMFVRMAGFWAVVAIAPFAVGQVVELRPPQWLLRTHLALAGAFLLLLLTSDLAFVRTDTFLPTGQFGPLAVALLVPAAAFAGWWLLACLGRIQTRTGVALFALGGSITTLALIVAGLVIDPVLADHFLVVAFLPVLAAAQLVELQRIWRERRLRPGRHTRRPARQTRAAARDSRAPVGSNADMRRSP